MKEKKEEKYDNRFVQQAMAVSFNAGVFAGQKKDTYEGDEERKEYFRKKKKRSMIYSLSLVGELLLVYILLVNSFSALTKILVAILLSAMISMLEMKLFQKEKENNFEEFE